MTDEEMTKLCAEAMGWTLGAPRGDAFNAYAAESKRDGGIVYNHFDPLHDAAQAMALEDWLISQPNMRLEYRYNQFSYLTCGFAYTKRKGDASARRRFLVECVANFQAFREVNPPPE